MRKQNRGRKIIIGLTGSFGSGKSTVARMFQAAGAKVIDADKICHNLIRPKTRIYQRIVKVFGKDILKNNKSIDRQKLAKKVFGKKNLVKKLNQIIHPEAIRIIKQQIKNALAKLIILDAPLIIEARARSTVGKLIVVKVNQKKQIERISKKTAHTKTEILKRIKSQMPLKTKVRLADFVIDNNGSIVKTRRQVEKIWRALWKN